MNVQHFEISEDGLKVRNGTGRWSIPIAWRGEIWPSQIAVANKAGINFGAVSRAAAGRRTVKGDDVRPATRDEIADRFGRIVKAFRREENGRVKVLVNGAWCTALAVLSSGRVHTRAVDAGAEFGRGRSWASAQVCKENGIVAYAGVDDVNREWPEAVCISPAGDDLDGASEHAFFGVAWPDGSVEVHLAGGGMPPIKRPSRDEIPDEILNSCRWASW